MTTTKKTMHLQKLTMSNNQLHFDKELHKAMKQYDKLLKVLSDK